MCGPGSAGRTTYNHPVAAIATSSTTGTPAALRTMEPPGGGEVRDRGVPAPERPVVAAVHDEVPMPQVQARQRPCEAVVLLQLAVTGAAVEPEVRVLSPQQLRDARDRQLRAVAVQDRLALPEDRRNRVGLLVTRPALDDAELARMVQGDVEGAVPALRQTADRPHRGRPVALLHRVHDVARDERLPPLVRADAVRPFLVR